MRSAKLLTPTMVVVYSLLLTVPSWAVTMDLEGTSSSGLNDTDTTAQDIGTIAAGGPVGLFFDIDFAEDIGATADDDVGLDPELWIFNSTGTLIASNDDSDFFSIGLANAGTDPGSDPFADHDPFIGELVLTPGMYFAAVSFYQNNANAEDQNGATDTDLSLSGGSWAGLLPDTSFENNVICSDLSDPSEQCTGPYRLQIRTAFADTLDQLTVQGWIDGNNENDVDFYKFTIGTNGTPGTPGAPIPEPSTMLLLGSGLAGLAWWRHRKPAV